LAAIRLCQEAWSQ